MICWHVAFIESTEMKNDNVHTNGLCAELQMKRAEDKSNKKKIDWDDNR